MEWQPRTGHDQRLVWLRAALFSLVLVVTTACSARQAEEVSEETQSGPPPILLDTDGQAGSDVVTISFAGDVHFTDRTAALLANPDQALDPIRNELSGADLTMVNLESAVTERGVPEPKEFHFRAPAQAFDAMRAAGIDVVSMANNHAVDYGSTGLQDSLGAIESTGFPVAGLGEDAEQAYAPREFDIRGQRVAILAASQVQDRTLSAWTATENSPGIASAYAERLVSSVQEAAEESDIVVVYVHWGLEGSGCPIDEQVSLAQRLAEAGADAVVGSHAHLLQGNGWMGSTYVAYGLGNYVWFRDNAFSNNTGVLTLSFQDGRAAVANFTPAQINSQGLPVQVQEPQAAAVLAEWEAARQCTNLTEEPS